MRQHPEKQQLPEVLEQLPQVLELRLRTHKQLAALCE